MENLKTIHDPYLRYVRDYNPTPGFTAFDYAKRQPTKNCFIRTYEIDGVEWSSFSKSPEVVLAQGAACGIDKNGVCQHFWLNRGLKFVGFLGGQTETEARVMTLGVIELRFGSIDYSKIEKGAPVFCLAPNEFSLCGRDGAPIIGVVTIVRVQENCVKVAFRKEGDMRPLGIKYKRPASQEDHPFLGTISGGAIHCTKAAGRNLSNGANETIQCPEENYFEPKQDDNTTPPVEHPSKLSKPIKMLMKHLRS